MTADDKISLHIDSAKKRDDLPEMGNAGKCERPDCTGNFAVGFGLAGGGYGAYEYCEVCGRVVSKTECEE